MSKNKNSEEKPKQAINSLVVGLGASAGGLDPLKTFIGSLPEKTEMAFIIIQHLAADHKSQLADILENKTSLSVQQVTEKTPIKPENIYIIPPDKYLKTVDTYLELADKEGHNPKAVDTFFRTLGKTKGAGSACIILSGTGSDGAAGLKTIKENNGLTMVQEPSQATYEGMPQSALQTGLVDKVLPVEAMYGELARYRRERSDGKIPATADELSEEDKQALSNIINKVNDETDNDFGDYKKSTLLRRIERRRHVTRQQTLNDYYAYLEQHAGEVHRLFKELLITVTGFFRDAEAFGALEENVIPKLFEKSPPDEQLRVWVPGCATGEEAYSVAILLRDYAHKNGDPRDIQIFASDVDEQALKTARKGVYPESVVSDLTDRQRDRYFKGKEGGGPYSVKKELREPVLFAKHNLLSDAPFSKLDLISCRNLLIYLQRDLQAEVFNLFHYALKSEGVLFLGKSDSTLEAEEAFTPFDKHNIFRKSSRSASAEDLPRFPLYTDRNRPAASHWREAPRTVHNYEKLHRQLLRRQYVPPSAIINENYEVLHATEDIDDYLKYKGGRPSLNLLEMAIPELRGPLHQLLTQAGKNGDELPLFRKTQVHLAEDPELVDVSVHNIKISGFSGDLMYVVFKKPELNKEKEPKKTAGQQAVSAEDEGLVKALQEELEDTKQQLQTSVEDYETSNEELRSSNEELQSMNEELQTTTEELETSQEELKSVNEEMKAVNGKLNDRVEQLERARNNVKNILAASPPGLLILDKKLDVTLFNRTAADIFNLIDSDVGRPFSHMAHHLDYQGVLADAQRVLDTLQKETEVVTTDNGTIYFKEITPYLTSKDTLEGVIMSFADITKVKEHEAQLQLEARQVDALAQLGEYAVEGRPLKEVVHRALQLIYDILEADCCLLFKLDRKQNKLQVEEAVGEEGESAEELDIQIDEQWQAARSLDEMESTIIDDFSKEERFSPAPVFNDKEMASGINVVVEGHKDAYGLLGMYSAEKRSFAEHDKSFLMVVANIIAEIIDRNRSEGTLNELNETLQTQYDRGKELQQEILDTSMAERWDLGAFLHDSLGQELAVAKMMVEGVNKKVDGEGVAANLKKIQDILAGSIDEVRELSHSIIPYDIDVGIGSAFKHLMDDSQELFDITCDLDYDEAFTEIKDRHLGTNLYLIVQEAIKNAHYHGSANRVSVSARCSDGEVTLQVADDGSGLPKDREESEGSGTRIMQHRIDLLGGSLQIEDDEGDEFGGAVVTCRVPLAKK